MTLYRFSPMLRTIHVNVELISTAGEPVKATMLIDTGASLSAIPDDLALRLGLTPEEPKLPVKTADGREVSLLTVIVPKIRLADAVLVDVRMACPPSSKLFQPSALLG